MAFLICHLSCWRWFVASVGEAGRGLKGKELQEDYKLNWYDFGARMYDNQIGRWHMVDPVNQNRSPYVAMGNNPLTMIDPNGMYFKPGRRTNYLIYTRQVLENRKRPTGLMYLPEEPEQLIWDDGGGNSAAKMRQSQIIKAWAEERYETLTAKEAPKDKPFKLQFADVDDLLEEIGVLEAMQPGMMHNVDGEDEDETSSEGGDMSFWDGLLLAWDLKVIGKDFPDLISFDITVNSTAVAGASMTYAVNFYTRGERGVNVTATEQNRFCGEIDWGLNLNVGYYQGNPLNITQSSVAGPVQSISAGWWIYSGQGYFGYDATGKHVWTGFGMGIGLSYGASYGFGSTRIIWP